MKIEHACAHEVITMNSVCTVEEAARVLETEHSGFPVLNLAGNLCGVISRSVLIKLIQQKAWYTKTREEIQN